MAALAEEGRRLAEPGAWPEDGPECEEAPLEAREVALVPRPPGRCGAARAARLGAGAIFALLATLAAASLCGPWARRRPPPGPPPEADARAFVGRSASGDACARSFREDCHGKRCCSQFESCFEKNSTWATCQATCALGASGSAPPWDPNPDFMPWTCKVVDADAAPAPRWRSSTASPSLYCFMVTLVAGNEPELVRRHLASGSGIFGCNAYDIFSEREMVVGPGPKGWIRSTAIGGPMSSTANNTRDFLRAWRKVRDIGAYKDHAWTLKIDPDAVFVADLLRPKLVAHAIDTKADAVYFKNCETWESLQGPLELMSNAAAVSFFDSLDRCYLVPLMMKVLGEDWFIGHCLDHIGARYIKDYDLLDDQWCTKRKAKCGSGMVAFHPFKTTESYEECLHLVQHEMATAV